MPKYSRHELLAALFVVSILLHAPFALAQSKQIQGVAIGPDFGAPMTFRMGPPTYNNRQRIYAVGEFTPGTLKAFNTFITEHTIKPGAVVAFHSPGGNLAAGIDVGEAIRAHSLDTIVAQPAANPGSGFIQRIASDAPGLCASACSMAYLGGINRRMLKGSLYGVHDAAFKSSGGGDLLDLGQKVAGIMNDYIVRMGASPHLLSSLTKYNSRIGETWWMSPTDMSKMHITTLPSTNWQKSSYQPRPNTLLHLISDNRSESSTEWNLENSKHGFVLEGRNTEASDIPNNFEKVVFACVGSPRHVVLGAYYMPEASFGDSGHTLATVPTAFIHFVTGYSISVLPSKDQPISNRWLTYTVPSADVVQGAKIADAHHVTAFVNVTPQLLKLLAHADFVTFQFRKLTGADGVRVDFTSGRDQALQFIQNCR